MALTSDQKNELVPEGRFEFPRVYTQGILSLFKSATYTISVNWRQQISTGKSLCLGVLGRSPIVGPYWRFLPLVECKCPKSVPWWVGEPRPRNT